MGEAKSSDNIGLIPALLELKQELDKYHIPILLGGGMGLYLRQTYIKEERQPKYSRQIPLRSTNDLDIFLTAELIVDAESQLYLRDALNDLGYAPEEPYFQFKKAVDWYGQPREIKIDLLAAPPKEGDEQKVKIKGIRVRAKEASKIHGYLTPEAGGIEIGKIELDVALLDKDIPTEGMIYIPSSYNYLICKLNAFHDRKDREDEKSDQGRHHAYDIFATVTAMTQGDWANAKNHYRAEKEMPYMMTTADFQRQYFSLEDDLGIIRLKENVGYQQHKEEFNNYIPAFLEDMNELFPDEEK